ncbi:MAG: T9SS type A sorting domain-containing protein [bacterium]|nr:MAG: T9SS type A sorting domain-containing protein [bacterium]
MRRKLAVSILAIVFVVFSASAVFSSSHTVLYPDLMENYNWTRGCTPTATAMVLSYWDNYVDGIGKYTYGRLIDYYVGLNGCDNIPNLIDQLADAMQTTPNGGTLLQNVDPGIETVTNGWNFYNFSATTSTYGDCNDSCWNLIKKEIDNNRPFAWHLHGATVGHSTAAFGYTDNGYVMLYDTWDSCPVFPFTQYTEFWYYRQWFHGDDGKSVTSVIPGGEGGQDLLLYRPADGDNLVAGIPYTIHWYQWGEAISHVTIEYSADDGRSWNVVVRNLQSAGEGWHNYTWTVPCVSTQTARVRIAGYRQVLFIMFPTAGDGSFDTFSINSKHLAVPSNVRVNKTASVRPDETYILSWDPVTYANSYDVYENGKRTNVGNVTSKKYSKTKLGIYKYRVRAKNACGAGDKSGTVSVKVSTFVAVWPGDLDNNGIVEAKDVLPLATYWYQTGIERDAVDIRWASHTVENWDDFAATFADADGSGRVDMGDFLSICLNWGKTNGGTGMSCDIADGREPRRDVLEALYQRVKDARSGPKYEIRSYLEGELGITPPASYMLGQNFPNPFNPATTIWYQVPAVSDVYLTVFNVNGQRIRVLAQGVHNPGEYSVVWDGKDAHKREVSSGIYFYKLVAGDFTCTKKMVLIR